MTSADLLAYIKKQPVGFICGALCVIIGALLYWRSDKIDENQTEFEARAAERTKILANVRNSENLPKQVADLQALSKEMDSRLIRTGQLAVNLQYFYKLEAENEVKLLEIRQGTPPKGAKSLYVGIPYTVNVQGTFKQVIAFLQHLEAGPHFCRFTVVSFNKAGGATADPGGLTADMTLTLNLELLGLP